MEYINWMTGVKVTVKKTFFSEKHGLEIVEYDRPSKKIPKTNTFLKAKYVFDMCYEKA